MKKIGVIKGYNTITFLVYGELKKLEVNETEFEKWQDEQLKLLENSKKENFIYQKYSTKTQISNKVYRINDLIYLITSFSPNRTTEDDVPFVSTIISVNKWSPEIENDFKAMAKALTPGLNVFGTHYKKQIKDAKQFIKKEPNNVLADKPTTEFIN